jgi:hypothetical protein
VEDLNKLLDSLILFDSGTLKILFCIGSLINRCVGSASSNIMQISPPKCTELSNAAFVFTISLVKFIMLILNKISKINFFLFLFAVKPLLIRVFSWPYKSFLQDHGFIVQIPHIIKQCHAAMHLKESAQIFFTKIQFPLSRALLYTPSSQVNSCESLVWEARIPNGAAHPVLSSVCICTSGRTFALAVIKSITQAGRMHQQN